MSVQSFYQALGIKIADGASEASVRCFANPDAHTHRDRDASCSINTTTGLWRCHGCGASGNAYQAALACGRSRDNAQALIAEHDLNDRRGGLEYPPRKAREAGKPLPNVDSAGVSVGMYAGSKRIPEGFLRAMGLRDVTHLGARAIAIPYTDTSGQEIAVQYRLALTKPDTGPDLRFRWRKGSKPCLYGLWGLDAAQRSGRVILAEGASDVHTLLFHGYPALGAPGSSSWSEVRDAEHFDGIGVIYAMVEPDTGGEAVLRKLSASRIAERVRLVFMPGATKDPSALYLADPEGFKAAFGGLLSKAVPLGEHQAALAAQRAETAWSRCADLAVEPRILDRVADDVGRLGHVGEDRAVKLLYLIFVSRLLSTPVSAGVKAPSSAGKSHLVATIMEFFPLDAFYWVSGMSERARAYSEEPLVHRMLVVVEAAAMESEFGSYLIRSLLSEGCVRYETIEKTPEGMKARLIERPGPTGLITTTTRLSLHPENETRMLSIPVNDSTEQTKAILHAIASDNDPESVDLGRWHALAEWTAGAEHRVVVPYAKHLADQTDAAAVRMRRDFGKVLALVRAHALLHQATRERDVHGRIVATIDDYRVVRDLIHDLIAEGVERTVPPDARQVVQQVAGMIVDREFVTITELAEDLKIDRKVIARRVDQALRGGWLIDVQEKRTRTAPMHLALGAPLPADQEVIPLPETLEPAQEAIRKREPAPQAASGEASRLPAPSARETPPPGRRTCRRCGEPYLGIGLVCDDCLDGGAS